MNNYGNISKYKETSIKSLNSFTSYIKNILSNSYHNTYIESNNNFNKVLKRSAFGFRSFKRKKSTQLLESKNKLK
ncbi:MAG TPA: transposase [Gallicola sp.]|nr:transposase [Gallicola sp.]